MADKFITRTEAKAKGLSRYRTGQPCKYGHFAERTTANGVCIECSKNIERRHREAHREKFQEKWRNYERNASHKRREQHRVANRKYHIEHADKIAEKVNRWKNTNRERVHQHQKKWREKHRDKHLAKIRRWHEANPLTTEEKVAAIERTRQWALTNPERAKELRRRIRQIRRARQLNAGGSYTQQEIDALLVKQNHTCVYCSTTLYDKRELDHWIPLKRQGSNDIANLQWLCVPCNRKKRDLDPIEFEASIGFVRTFAPGL